MRTHSHSRLGAGAISNESSKPGAGTGQFVATCGGCVALTEINPKLQWRITKSLHSTLRSILGLPGVDPGGGWVIPGVGSERITPGRTDQFAHLIDHSFTFAFRPRRRGAQLGSTALGRASLRGSSCDETGVRTKVGKDHNRMLCCRESWRELAALLGRVSRKCVKAFRGGTGKRLCPWPS